MDVYVHRYALCVYLSMGDWCLPQKVLTSAAMLCANNQLSYDYTIITVCVEQMTSIRVLSSFHDYHNICVKSANFSTESTILTY